MLQEAALYSYGFSCSQNTRPSAILLARSYIELYGRNIPDHNIQSVYNDVYSCQSTIIEVNCFCKCVIVFLLEILNFRLEECRENLKGKENLMEELKCVKGRVQVHLYKNCSRNHGRCMVYADIRCKQRVMPFFAHIPNQW